MQTRPRSSSNERASETSEGRGGGGSKFFAPSAARRPKPTLETTTRFSDVSWQPTLTREPVNRLASLGSSGAVRERDEKKRKFACQHAVPPAVQNVQRSAEVSAARRTRCVYRPFVAHLRTEGKGGEEKNRNGFERLRLLR